MDAAQADKDAEAYVAALKRWADARAAGTATAAHVTDMVNAMVAALNSHREAARQESIRKYSFGTQLQDVEAVIERLEGKISVIESRAARAPIVDCGVWREGTDYAAGSAVTRSGSLWIARCKTFAKPGKSDDWRLAVKSGRVKALSAGVKLFDGPRPAAN